MAGHLNPLAGIVYASPERAAYYFKTGAWIDRTIGEQLHDIARNFPDRAAFICEGRQISFREIDEWSDQLGALIVQRGLRVNDRAMFQMGTVIETAVALFACYKSGVLPVCTIPQYRDIEIGKLAVVTTPRGYFAQADFDPKFDLAAFARKMCGECAIPHLFVARAGVADDPWQVARSIPLADARKVLAAIRIGAEDVCAMQLSGGSTGVPKVIPRHHAEYLGHAFHWSEKLGMTADDIGLWALPILHNAGMLWAFLRTILYGSTAVLMPRFEVRQFFELIQAHKVTHCFTIGPLVPAIVGFADVEKFDSRSVKFFYTLQGAEQIERRTGFTSSNMFGITEGLLLQGRATDPIAMRHLTVGSVNAPWDEVRLKTPDGVDDVPLGEVGELCFRGPSSLRAYYNAPEANATAFTPDGFFRTGDLMSAHGFGAQLAYRFEGRMRDNINRGGEKFGTEELEQLMVQHPAIADGKVVAMPDPIFGEKACAFLVAKPDATLPTVKELGEFLSSKGLAKYKLPERIESINAFPVTRVGKLDRARLRAIVAEKMKGEG